MASGSTNRLLAAACWSPVVSLTWRHYWIYYHKSAPDGTDSKLGKSTGHALRLQISFRVNLPSYNAFILYSDPGLLNGSTPSWFDIRFASGSDDPDNERFSDFRTSFRQLNWDWYAAFRDAEDAKTDFSTEHSREARVQRLREAEVREDWRDYLHLPIELSYWVKFFGLVSLPWTSQVLICGKVLNPDLEHGNTWFDYKKREWPLDSAISERDRIRMNREAVEQASTSSDSQATSDSQSSQSRSLMKKFFKPSISGLADIVTPVTTAPWEVYYRMAYRQSAGPYRFFEHTHLIIEPLNKPHSGSDSAMSQTASAAAASQQSDSNKSDENEELFDENKESCIVEDTIVFSVFGEPIGNYVALYSLKLLLRARCQWFRKEYGVADYSEVVSVV